MKRVMILNGPNLNLLGVREPHIYGTTTLEQIRQNCEREAAALGLTVSFHQSNHEGELVDLIQSARQGADAIIINPAAYSFTSIAMVDAIKTFEARCWKCTFPTSTPATSITGIRGFPMPPPR